MKILVVLVSIISIAVCQQQHRLCLYITSESIKYCDEINKSNEVQCVQAADSVDCVMKLKNDEADFTVLFPEQALLASEFINEKVSVIAEIRAKSQETLKHNFQMVLVVKKSHIGGLNGLRGKKYCHPGFSSHELWSPRTLKEAEAVIFRDQLRQNCNQKENISYVEREIKVIHDFFGDSCRNGPWTEDSILNNELEKKYSKLTALCNSNTEKNSLTCLNMQQADVAYATLSDALQLTNKDEYRLLCKNDILVPINANISSDCSWRNQPWTLIVSTRNKAQLIQTNLYNWIKDEYKAITEGATPFGGPINPRVRKQWEDTLANILLRDTNQYRLNVLQDQPLPQSYLERNTQNVDSAIPSECPMRWCVVSQQEQTKCEWLAKASLQAGIEPQISCIPGEQIYDCLKKIKENNADIIAIDSNYGYLARKMGHQNLLFSENSAQDIASIIAVIHDDSAIQSFKDLKNSDACFPEYRGLAWVSFIDSARRHGVMKNNCEFGKSVSEFFNGICAPGAKDNYHYRQNNEVYDKLCSLCSDNCQSDLYNRYFNNTGALNCLAENTAKVAFVEWQAIDNLPNLNNYRILCDNDRVVTLNEFKQDITSCSLSNTIDSEVIARHNDTRKTDYKHALLQMDILFGASFVNEQTFLMFKEFNGEKNLLFKKNVLGLADYKSSNEYVKNYVKLFESVDKCTSGSPIVNVSTITLFIASLLLLVMRQM